MRSITCAFLRNSLYPHPHLCSPSPTLWKGPRAPISSFCSGVECTIPKQYKRKTMSLPPEQQENLARGAGHTWTQKHIPPPGKQQYSSPCTGKTTPSYFWACAECFPTWQVWALGDLIFRADHALIRANTLQSHNRKINQQIKARSRHPHISFLAGRQVCCWTSCWHSNQQKNILKYAKIYTLEKKLNTFLRAK